MKRGREGGTDSERKEGGMEGERGKKREEKMKEGRKVGGRSRE